MTPAELRGAIYDARLNAENWKGLVTQLLVIAAMVGISAQSVLAGVVAAVAQFVILLIPVLSAIYIVFVTSVYGVMGGCLTYALTNKSAVTGVVVGLVVWVLAMCAQFSGRQYLRD